VDCSGHCGIPGHDHSPRHDHEDCQICHATSAPLTNLERCPQVEWRTSYTELTPPQRWQTPYSSSPTPLLARAPPVA
jgi:hypothetical protein